MRNRVSRTATGLSLEDKVYQRLGYSLLVCAAVASAQENIDRASLTGRVADPSGAVISGAAITARSAATGRITATTTDDGGRFRFAALGIGGYEVRIHQPGFADAVRTVDLTLGAAFHLPITLALGSAQTVVEIHAPAPVIETDRSQIAATVDEQEVDDLPYNGRNFLDLALLVPGVSPTNTAANQLFAETSAVAGQGISVSSQRNFSNSFIVDGLSANDDAAGLVQTSFALDTIAEMQVVTSGGQAEFGRAIGGYVNFVTRSGSDHLHGSVYGFLRDKLLNARNALSATALPYTQVQTGASLGGPLRRDRSFFFANFEQRQLNQTGLLTISGANATAINTTLNAIGYAGKRLAVDSSAPTTVYPNPVRTSNFFAKVDHQLNDREQMTLRYSLYHVSSVNSRGVGGISDVSAGASLEDLDQTIAASSLFTLNPRTVNETRAQFTNSNLAAPANDAVGPAVSISGVASFGTLSSSPTARYDRLFEVVNNISHQAGPHALRTGADFLFNDLTITYPQSVRGSYSFGSCTQTQNGVKVSLTALQCFQNGIYSTFTQSFGNFVIPQTNPNVGLYLQDEWKASRKLTLNTGVRFDLQFLQSIATDTNNISPRIGFAFSPFSDGRTVVRGSFGLFYDRIPLRALSNALESNDNRTAIDSNTFTTIALSYGQAGAPVFPHVDSGYTATSIPSNLRLSLSTMDPHIQNAYSEQSSLEVDQQLTSTSDVSISYQHLRGLHLLVSVNLNTPTCYASVDPVNLCRPNAAYANNKQYSSAADSYYDGLSVSYVQRPVRWGSYRISYTWSKAIDDVSEFFFSSPVNNFNLREDRSLSDDDQRHRIVVDAIAHTSLQPAHTWRSKLVHGFLLSGILQYYSPFPFNIVTGQNSVQTTALRPCAPGFVPSATASNTCGNALPGTMIGRNAGVGFNSFNVNARLSRTIALNDHLRLEGIAEAFNALNHRNSLFPNATFGTGNYPSAPLPAFGTPTAVADPRSIQFAAKLTF